MRRLGVIGGIGPESTIAYYRSIIAASLELGTGGYPPILIASIDLPRVLRLVEENALESLADYIATEIETLGRAGAVLGLIAANTPHIVFDEVRRRSSIPLVSIVESTRDAIRALGLKRLGIFGTRFTMQGSFYRAVLSPAGIELVAPEPNQQAYIHEKYVSELLRSIFLPKTHEEMLRIVRSMTERDGVEGVILAGTELPLLLTDARASGVPLLNTTEIHVRAAANAAWGCMNTRRLPVRSVGAREKG